MAHAHIIMKRVKWNKLERLVIGVLAMYNKAGPAHRKWAAKSSQLKFPFDLGFINKVIEITDNTRSTVLTKVYL